MRQPYQKQLFEKVWLLLSPAISVIMLESRNDNLEIRGSTQPYYYYHYYYHYYFEGVNIPQTKGGIIISRYWDS